MLRFTLLGFPVTVQWWFWLLLGMLGGAFRAQGPDEWTRVLVWVGVGFVSIMVHELGHALAARKCGSESTIELHGMGGVTRFSPIGFTKKDNIFVTLSGPAGGFILAAVFWALNVFLAPHVGFVGRMILQTGIVINIIWTILNLLPIFPMDGGQVLYQVLGPQRRGMTAGIGAGLAILVGVFAFQQGQIFLAILMGFMAFQNFALANQQDPQRPF